MRERAASVRAFFVYRLLIASTSMMLLAAAVLRLLGLLRLLARLLMRLVRV